MIGAGIACLCSMIVVKILATRLTRVSLFCDVWDDLSVFRKSASTGGHMSLCTRSVSGYEDMSRQSLLTSSASMTRGLGQDPGHGSVDRSVVRSCNVAWHWDSVMTHMSRGAHQWYSITEMEFIEFLYPTIKLYWQFRALIILLLTITTCHFSICQKENFYLPFIILFSLGKPSSKKEVSWCTFERILDFKASLNT